MVNERLKDGSEPAYIMSFIGYHLMYMGKGKRAEPFLAKWVIPLGRTLPVGEIQHLLYLLDHINNNLLLCVALIQEKLNEETNYS